jgi:two-component system cell cycle response regulator DivK
MLSYPERVPGRAAAPARQRRVVLLVDDCPDTRELYAEYLELSGYDVKEAGDGMSAVQEALRSAPDVVVMDMSLPGMDGREATRRLRADDRTRAIPVVMVSGFTPDAALPAGSDDAPWDLYLGKPCLPDDLVAAIERLLAPRS